MHTILLRLFPSADEKEAVKGFLAGLLGPTRVQPGCMECILAMEYDPEAILYIETWQSKENFSSRLQSSQFSRLLVALETSVKTPEVTISEVIDLQGLKFISSLRRQQVAGHSS